MILGLTPHHGVETECVSCVALTEDADGKMVCRIYWHSGKFWEIKGQYAVAAWMGWINFWETKNKIEAKVPCAIEVKVPCAIIKFLRQNAGALVTGQEASTS